MAGRKPRFRDQSFLGILRGLGGSVGRAPANQSTSTGAQPPFWSPPMVVASAALVVVIVVSIIVLAHVYSSGAVAPAPLPLGNAAPAAQPTAVMPKLVLSLGTPITPTTMLGGSDAASTLVAPQEALRGKDGLYYVADTGNHRIAVLNGHGSLVRQIVRGPTGPLQSPASLAFTHDGHLLVLDSDSGLVLEYTTAGKLIATSSKAVPFVHARGMGIDALGQVYVADPATDGIFTLDSGLNLIHQETASPDGGKTFLFQQPTAVAPASGGLFYVVDGQNQRLDLFNASWQLQEGWPLAISDTIHSPRVLPLANGQALVSDAMDNKVLLYTPDHLQPAVYSLTTVAGPPAAPLGIAAAGRHRLLVTATGANQVWLVPVPGLP
ncbi:MAG TPA: NHL repeat-containing protein [Chloroflexota bacterium]|nr:NHL repeat-containing protein [Chloroflexota bacterium]